MAKQLKTILAASAIISITTLTLTACSNETKPSKDSCALTATFNTKIEKDLLKVERYEKILVENLKTCDTTEITVTPENENSAKDHSQWFYGIENLHYSETTNNCTYELGQKIIQSPCLPSEFTKENLATLRTEIQDQLPAGEWDGNLSDYSYIKIADLEPKK